MCYVLGIPGFISKGIQSVTEFESMVNLIHNIESFIETKLQSMLMANLMKFPVPDGVNELPGKSL